MCMVCTNGCPFDNYNCMCQFCEDPCNNGLNCSDCEYQGKIMHTVYLCTGFKGDTVRYIENWRRGVTGGKLSEPEGTG